MSDTPTTPGFYWAKWRSAAPGTADNGEGCLGSDAVWEVVEVWENSLEPSDPEYLMVHVGGVEQAQATHRFEWGPGPLVEPGAPDLVHQVGIVVGAHQPTHHELTQLALLHAELGTSALRTGDTAAARAFLVSALEYLERIKP